MRETELTTLIYKYNPYARFLVVLYIIGMFFICVFASDWVPMYIIWLALCIWAIPLVYAAVSKKTVFNFRALDSRLLTLSSSCIKAGKQKFPIKDSTVELQVNAYDGFAYRIRREGLLTPQTTYGVNNMLLVTYQGITYDYEFHLRNYADYSTLCEVTEQWQAAGVKLKLKEAFTREFINKQHARLMKKKKTY
jgi:hypothetical protein